MKGQVKLVNLLIYIVNFIIRAGRGLPFHFATYCFKTTLYGKAPIYNIAPKGGAFICSEPNRLCMGHWLIKRNDAHPNSLAIFKA